MNMMTTDAWTGDKDSATSKLVAAWEQKLTKNTAKAAGLGLMAVSLAACGDSDSNDAPVTPVTPVTPVAPTTVNGADNDGEAVDGGGTAVVELKGNTDPNVDAGEWINVATLMVRDANGDFTITDLQASENDASDGSAGMDIMLDDIGQNTAGTTTLNFDTQAIDEADTVVNLSLDEVAGTVALTGNSAIETVNVTIADGTNEASDLADLQIAGVTTLNIAGGIAGQSFTVQDALDTTITTLDASAAVGDLDLSVAGGAGGSYALGSGDDHLTMADSYGSTDTVSGGAGADVVSMVFANATIREGTMTGVETLDAVFNAAATFDGTNVDDLATANLGIDATGAEVANTADADFNDMDATFTTLNIHSTSQDVEVDYASGVDATLTINLGNDSGAATIGDDANSNDIHLLGVQDLTINHISSNTMTINNDIDLNDDTETLTITTSMEGGDLIIADNNDAAFANGGSLTDVLVAAVDGDMDISFNNGTFNFIDDATELQTYEVTADDADLLIGEIGDNEAAVELETLILNMVDESSLEHAAIDAYQNNVGANISLFEVTASDKNITANGRTVSVYLEGLEAEQVDNMILNANDGGDIELDDQEYVVTTQTYTGTGDISITAGDNNGGGFDQTQAADASAHSGSRDYQDGNADDIFYGSTGDDTVDMTDDGDDVYFDAGGSDTVTVGAGLDSAMIYDDGTASATDTGSATDDTYVLAGTGGTGAASDTQFNAGGGTDAVNLASGTVHVNYADFDSGIVNMTNFTTGADSLSFDGLGAITAASGTDYASAAVGNMNVNDVHVFADGDAEAIAGITVVTIADYTNMTDVADYLDSAFTANQSSGDEAVFIINNGGTTANTGDTQDAYIYYYEETGTAGIQAADLTLIGTADGSTIVATDVV